MSDRPKRIEIIARGVWRCEGRVLLCRNLEQGYCYLPGGHVEPGEAAADALTREFREETGVDVSAGPLLLIAEFRFIQSGRPRHELNLVFHVEHHAAPPTAIDSLEPHIGFEWIDAGRLGGVDLRPGFLTSWLVDGGADSSSRPGWISVSQ